MTAHRRTVGRGQLQETRTAVSPSCGPRHPQQWTRVEHNIGTKHPQHNVHSSGPQHPQHWTKTSTAQSSQQWATTSTTLDQYIHSTYTAFIHSIQHWTTTSIAVDPNDHSNGPHYRLICHTVQMLIYLRCFHDDNTTLGKQGCASIQNTLNCIVFKNQTTYPGPL